MGENKKQEQNRNAQVAGELREALRLLVRRLGVLEKDEAAGCSMSMGQCHALVEVGRDDNLTVNQLAGILGLDKSTVSRMVEKMVTEELLCRREDPVDRRYNSLSLSTKGRLVFRGIENNMNEYYQKVLGKIPEEKREQVSESLSLLLGAMSDRNAC